MDAIGTFDWAMLVHGEQAITLHQPLPVEGTAMIKGRVAAMYDKGKAAVVVLESEADRPVRRTAVDQRRCRRSSAARAAGAATAARAVRATSRPSASPTRSCRTTTRTDQALLYRLNGDRNPLHSDPTFAKLRRVPEADPARALHVRVHRAGAAARGVRERPGAVQVDRGPVLDAR